MWEAIAKSLTSANGVSIMVFLLALTVIFIVLLKVGFIRMNFKNIKIGNGSDERERSILRHQIEWSHLYVMGLEAEIRNFKKDCDEYLLKYLLEQVYDYVVEWISFNHIQDNPCYIEIKQEKIWSLFQCECDVPEFKTNDFKRHVYLWMESIIKRLVKIREVYSA